MRGIDLNQYRPGIDVADAQTRHDLELFQTRLTSGTYTDPTGVDYLNLALAYDLHTSAYFVSHPVVSATATVAKFMTEKAKVNTGLSFDILDFEVHNGFSKRAVSVHFIQVVVEYFRANPTAEFLIVYSANWFLVSYTDINYIVSELKRLGFWERIVFWLANYSFGSTPTFEKAEKYPNYVVVPTQLRGRVALWQFTDRIPVTKISGQPWSCDASITVGFEEIWEDEVVDDDENPLEGKLNKSTTLVNLNVRTKPSTSAPILMVFPIATEFAWLEIVFDSNQNPWLKIADNIYCCARWGDRTPYVSFDDICA